MVAVFAYLLKHYHCVIIIIIITPLAATYTENAVNMRVT